jgi:hypothetical protein
MISRRLDTLTPDESLTRLHHAIQFHETLSAITGFFQFGLQGIIQNSGPALLPASAFATPATLTTTACAGTDTSG